MPEPYPPTAQAPSPSGSGRPDGRAAPPRTGLPRAQGSGRPRLPRPPRPSSRPPPRRTRSPPGRPPAARLCSNLRTTSSTRPPRATSRKSAPASGAVRAPGGPVAGSSARAGSRARPPTRCSDRLPASRRPAAQSGPPPALAGSSRAPAGLGPAPSALRRVRLPLCDRGSPPVDAAPPPRRLPASRVTPPSRARLRPLQHPPRWLRATARLRDRRPALASSRAGLLRPPSAPASHARPRPVLLHGRACLPACCSSGRPTARSGPAPPAPAGSPPTPAGPGPAPSAPCRIRLPLCARGSARPPRFAPGQRRPRRADFARQRVRGPASALPARPRAPAALLRLSPCAGWLRPRRAG
nr:vegetative cell wall protein gp1-like [Aegilops tauschii subsp. strangulata]